MKRFIIFLILIILAGFACREEPTKPPSAEFTLTAEDIGVTDLFFRVNATLSHGPPTIEVKRDGEQIFQFTLTSQNKIDTILYDENLSPNQHYMYKTFYKIVETVYDSSPPMYIATLDTTNHEIFWEVDTLGDGNSSILMDVVIVSDTCVFVVGEIYKKDSIGQFDDEHYALGIWNGREWSIQKLKVLTPAGFYSILGPEGVFAFDKNDVWLANGDVHHYNGNDIDSSYWLSDWAGNPNPILSPGQSVERIWGTTNHNLYAVGRGGAVVTFDGSSWKKIESGTDVNLTAVWGTQNGSVVWACGWEEFKPTVLLKIQNNSIEKVYEDYDHRTVVRGDTLSGILIGGISENKINIVYSSAGVYTNFAQSQNFTRRLSFTSSLFPTAPKGIGGVGRSDFFIIGYPVFFAHFNGTSWRQYTELQDDEGRIQSVSQLGKLIVAVGHYYHPYNSRGLIYIGRR